ncbi:zinc ribbon domain-containing protein [Clostridium weizhouense]|uniref:Zinc ribbon domain-containing protein n=1 Tax=Clostridium weizhouense TaxID=2859781 RepID=A0ABS7ALM8_9CLOT|nr:zinc ribbon domain-containing protein [Clostridium weizhouense]MBW6409566.1 zinc ribbon domain-containing protein [Clostridium weizhouense]
MFFIGIFGIENKDIEIKVLNNIVCEKCNTTVIGRLVKNYDYFHFFFIPFLKWNESYYVVCNNCASIYSIPKEKGKAIENGEDIELTYWDFKKTNNIYYDDYYEPKVCCNCGKRLEYNFQYCPYCGEKIK